MTKERAADVGEFRLIERVRKLLNSPPADETWSGDDAAVVRIGGAPVVFTTDMLVEGIDFDLAYSDPVDVGFKAIAVNASDAAAMGGLPERAVCALGMPSSTPSVVVQDLGRGFAEAASEIGVETVGGDISTAGEVTLSVAVVGSLPGPLVTRAGARVGDLICVTGALGGAAGGLFALQNGMAAKDDLRPLIRRQTRPMPRVAEGIALASSGATSMIDVSDGLLADLGHILDASGVGCEIDTAHVPLDPALAALEGSPGGQSAAPLRVRSELEGVVERSFVRAPPALDLALGGGEDLELLFTIDEAGLDGARTAAGPTQISVIGRVEPTDRRVGGRPLEEWESKGWQHLQRP